jgi:biopolymer transport protein ExbB/TolQ
MTWVGTLSLSVVPATVLAAFETSDLFSQLIVLCLVVMSIYAWTLMVDKSVEIRRAVRGNREVTDAFRNAHSPLDLWCRRDGFAGPLAEVLDAGIGELAAILELDAVRMQECCRRHELPRYLSDNEVERIRSVLERTVDGHAMRLEDRLGSLATTVTLSPFLGLLGTVWGVMLTFMSMAQAGRADIRAMAPGVAGALLTTVVGLCVAIPAVVGYNSLVNRAHRATAEMDRFVDEFVSLLRLDACAAPQATPRAKREN